MLDLGKGSLDRWSPIGRPNTRIAFLMWSQLYKLYATTYMDVSKRIEASYFPGPRVRSIFARRYPAPSYADPSATCGALNCWNKYAANPRIPNGRYHPWYSGKTTNQCTKCWKRVWLSFWWHRSFALTYWLWGKVAVKGIEPLLT